MVTLTTQEKNIVDSLLGFAGAFVGYLSAHTALLPQSWQVGFGFGGLVIGYAITDAMGIIDTGKAPSAAVLQQQVVGAWNAALPVALANIKKITSPADQLIALAALQQAQNQLFAQYGLPSPVLVLPA